MKQLRNRAFILFMFSLLSFSLAKADNGLGVIIGDPTGLSGRLGLGDKNSIDAALAFSSGHYEGLHFQTTYLWEDARRIQLQKDFLSLYYGLGARIISINKGRYDGDIAIGPRAPIGLMYKIQNPNIEIFGELSAALDLAPRTDVDLDVGLGFRVRF